MAALVLAASAVPSGAVAALIALGAIVAIGGHLAGSRRVIVGGYLAYRDDPVDPRPCAEPGTC